MRAIRLYAGISLGGLVMFVGVIAVAASLRGNALVLLWLAYDWVMLCGAVGILLVGVTAVRRFATRVTA
jgi:hypothetical protein